MLLAGPSYALRTNEQSISNYVINTGCTPEMKALTACCWIKTNLKTGEPHCISYATAHHSNSFLLFNYNPQNTAAITVLGETKTR